MNDAAVTTDLTPDSQPQSQTDGAAPDDAAFSAPVLTLPALFGKFLKFGCLAFGGPVAQIAMIRHTLVDEERWISPARFNRLLAVMQILPGPEAHELCVHMGLMARGRIGGFLAGLGFMLPGFVLMLALAWFYSAHIAGLTVFSGVLLGLQVAVLAVIARAVQRIGQHVLTDLTLVGLAALAFLATLAGVPFWIPLLTMGLVYMTGWRAPLCWAVAAIVCTLGWVLFAAVPAGPEGAAAGHGAAVGILALFIAGLKGGLLTFGGAYTAIPYVRHDTVGRGWISDASFLDGVAFAGILPAPLVIFGTFVGYLAGGWVGALALTAGIFLPAFAFSMIFYERLEAILDHAPLHRFLDGVAAAVVGAIAGTLLQLAEGTFAQAHPWPVAAALLVLCGVVAWRAKGRLAMPAVLILGGGAGWLLLG